MRLILPTRAPRSIAVNWCWAVRSPTLLDGGVLLFRGDSPAAAEAFAQVDPYVLNGLVTRWRVREWTTVVGRDAEVALPPM